MTYNIIDSSIKKWYKDTVYKNNTDVSHNGVVYTSLVSDNKGNDPELTTNQFWKEKSYTEQYIPVSLRSDNFFKDQILIIDYILKYFSIITDDKAIVNPKEIADLAESVNIDTDYGGLSRWTGVLYPLLGSKFSIEAIPMIAKLASRLYEWSDHVIKSDISIIRALRPKYELHDLLKVEVDNVMLNIFDNDNSVLYDEDKFYIWFREFNNNVNFSNISSLYTTYIETTTIKELKDVTELVLPYRLLQYDVLNIKVNGNLVKMDENVQLSSYNILRMKYLKVDDVVEITINLLDEVWFANGIFKDRIFVAPRLKDKGAFGLDFYDFLDDKLYKNLCDAIHDLKWIGKDFTYLSSTTSPMQLSLSTYYEYENKPELGKVNPYKLGKDYVGTPSLYKYRTSNVFTQRIVVSDLESVDANIIYDGNKTTYVSLSKIPINVSKDMNLKDYNEFIESAIVDSFVRVEIEDDKVYYYFDDLYLTFDKLPFQVKSHLMDKYNKYEYRFSKDYHEIELNEDWSAVIDPITPDTNIIRVDKQSTYIDDFIMNDVSITKLPDLQGLLCYEGELLSRFRTAKVINMSEVFNNWPRFDGNNYYINRKFAEGESKDWQLLDNGSRVSMPTNTNLGNGLLSLDKYDSYEFEAVLTSSSTDDDMIGLIACSVVMNGKMYYLAITVDGLGAGTSKGCEVIFMPGGEYISSSKVVLGSYDLGVIRSGWDNRFIKVKIIRDGNIIKFYSSPWNSYELDSNSEVVVDLNSNDDLKIFKGKKPYGFLTWSQPDSTYLNVSFKGGLNENRVIDITNFEYYDYNGTEWIKGNNTLQEEYGFERLITDPYTGVSILIKQKDILIL